MMTPQNRKAQGGATTPTKGKARNSRQIEQVESNTEHLIQSTLNHYDEDGFLNKQTTIKSIDMDFIA